MLEEEVKDFSVTVTSKGALDKISMMKLMKLIGDFSKRKQVDVALESQVK